MTDTFYLSEVLKAIQSGQPIIGKNDVLASLVKQLTEAALGGTRQPVLST